MRALAPLLVSCLLVAVGCSEGSTSSPSTDAFVDGSMTWDTQAPRSDLYVDLTVDMTWPDTNQPTPDTYVPSDLTVDQPIGPPPGNDLCVVPEQVIWTGAPIIRQGSTLTATNNVDLGGNSCTGDWTSGGDVFYQVTLPAGSYSVTLTPAQNLDMALYVLSACNPPTCVGGSDYIGGSALEIVYLQPAAGTTYIIGVDAYAKSQNGPFTLEIKSAIIPDGGMPDSTVDAGIDGAVDAGPAPDGAPGPFSNKCVGCDLSINDCTGKNGVYICVLKSDTCTYTDGTLYRQCDCTGWQYCLSNNTWSTACEPVPNIFWCI